MLVRVALAAVAGVSLSAAFEPLAFPWVTPVAVAGLALLTRDQSPRRSLVVGLAFGAAFYFPYSPVRLASYMLVDTATAAQSVQV